MIRIAERCSASGRSRRESLSLRPSLEGLEERRVLSSLDGGQWTYPIRITYSLMPDGTSLGGVPSNLFATLNRVATTAAWEGAFAKAAAVWQQSSNINLVVTSDNGAQLGAPGDQQGDPNFGDIRIGGMDLGDGGILAETFLPPPVNGGSDAGDIIFNTNSSINWQVNSGIDVETVALHELGHALGLGHSTVQAAEMYPVYNEVKQSLNSDDISGIQGIYGAPAVDTVNNGSISNATDLTSLTNGQGQISLPGQYISGPTDYDFYKVTVPSTTNGTMVVKMQATGLSSLAPRLALFNSLGGTIGQTLAVNGYGATVTYTVTGVTPGQVFYLRASVANTGPGSDGAYGILVNFGPYSQSPIAPPNTVVPAQLDQGGGSSGESLPTGNLHGHHHKKHHHPAKPTATPKHDSGKIRVGHLHGLGDKLVIGRPHPGHGH